MKRLLIIIPFSALMITGCTVKEPGTPRWLMEVTFPLADRQYSMLELVDTSEVDPNANWISQNGDTLIFNFADSLDRVTLEDRLNMDAFNNAIEGYVGVRTVNSPGIESAYYLLEDIAPQLLPYIGQTIPVSPFDFSLGADNLPPFDEFDWVYVDDGDITITVTNELPAPVENLSIDIFAKNPHILVTHIDMPVPLNPGSGESQVLPLPIGPEIDNEMEVYISGHSPGSTIPVLIEADAQLQVEAEISQMGITSAYAHLPEQNFSADTIYALAENDTISSATIKTGYLTFSATNNTDLINNVVFTLPDFSLEGAPFSQSFALEPNEQLTISDLNLTDYVLDRPQMDKQIQVEIDVNIIDTADPAYNDPDGMVTINQNQNVAIDFYMSELIFEEFSGILDTLYLDLTQEALELERMPQGLEFLELESANIDLHLTNSIELPLYFDIRMEAYKNGGAAASCDLPLLMVQPGDTLNPGYLDTTLTGLQAIFNVMPEEIQLRGNAYIMGGAAVQDCQWLEVEYVIYTPLSLKIGDTYLQPKISRIDNGFDKWLNQVDLTMNLISHMPLSGNAYIIASIDSLGLLNGNAADSSVFIQATLPEATINSMGYVTQTGNLTVNQTLNLDQLEMFSQASDSIPLFIKMLITINSTQGDTVRFTPNDYLTVGAAAHAMVDVHFEDDEGGQ